MLSPIISARFLSVGEEADDFFDLMNEEDELLSKMQARKRMKTEPS